MKLKQEMKQYLRLHSQNPYTTTISFSVKKQPLLEWESDDEFSLHGQMYDVIKKAQQGDTITVYCIADIKETALIKKILQQNAKEAPLKGKADTRTPLLNWYYHVAERHGVAYFSSSILSHQAHYSFVLPQAEQNVLAPPPRSVS